MRHEFLEGEIYAMAGGTPEHAALSMSAGAALMAAARGGPCRVHSSDLRVRVLATGLVTYPDVTVVCGPYETDPDSPTTITNPRVVVEVTSDSTEEYDRGEKLESYKQVPTLAAVVFVSQRERLIEVIERGEEGRWRRLAFFTAGGDKLRPYNRSRWYRFVGLVGEELASSRAPAPVTAPGPGGSCCLGASGPGSGAPGPRGGRPSPSPLPAIPPPRTSPAIPRGGGS